MKNAFIIHGAYGHPKENWFPWLKSELEKLNYQVFVPQFPTPKNQTLENWKEVFEKYKEYLDSDSILIGHSLGPVFLLSVIEKIERPINCAFFVSGFISKLDNPDFDSINKSFTEKEFDWKKIKDNCPKFCIFHSNNDPYVPIEKAEELAKKLNAGFEIIKNAGHFNESSGYNRFELLLKRIKELD